MSFVVFLVFLFTLSMFANLSSGLCIMIFVLGTNGPLLSVSLRVSSPVFVSICRCFFAAFSRPVVVGILSGSGVLVVFFVLWSMTTLLFAFSFPGFLGFVFFSFLGWVSCGRSP